MELKEEAYIHESKDIVVLRLIYKELTDVEIYTIWKNNFKKINNYVLNYLEQKKSKKDEKIQSDIKRKRK